MTINEVIVDFPAPEQYNLRHIRRNASEDESNKAETQSDEVEQEEPSEVPEEDQVSDTEEFMIARVADHKRNRSRKHRYAKYSETLFRVRWYV